MLKRSALSAILVFASIRCVFIRGFCVVRAKSIEDAVVVVALRKFMFEFIAVDVAVVVGL